MNSPALLKTVLLVAAIGAFQAREHYFFLFHTGPLAMTAEQQKARAFKQCLQEINPTNLTAMPDIWFRKRARDAERTCHAKVYEDRTLRLDEVGAHPTYFKLDGQWHDEKGGLMLQTREQCLAQIEDNRRHAPGGLNAGLEARMKARCAGLYTEAEDKQYPKDTPW